MVWEEMSYNNKYQGLSMAQRLRNEYEPDYIYFYIELIDEEDEEYQDEFTKTNISLFY